MINKAKMSGAQSAVLISWLDGKEDQKQTILFVDGIKPLQTTPEIKEIEEINE